MITTFFEGSEECGLGQLRMHKQLDDGTFIKKIVVETKMPSRRGVDANFIEINTYSNMTIWEFKRIIAQCTNSSPLCINIKRSDSKKPDIKDFRNCKLLSDLKLSKDETLSVMKARPSDPIKVPLVDKDGEMVPELLAIILSWFETFSVDLTREQVIEIHKNGAEDGAITDEQAQEIPEKVRAMTRESCVDFVEAITTVQDLPVNDYRVTTLFDEYSKKMGNGNLLLEEELLGFYAEKAKNREEVVRQNLLHQGIWGDLKPKIDYNSLTWESDTRIVRDESILPRAKLSSNHELFDQLLQLLDCAQADEAEGIWNLLMSLQTNSQVQEKILNNDNLSELFGIQDADSQHKAGSLSSNNLYRVFYCL